MNGQVLFICVVLVTNLKVLQDTHNYHIIGELLIMSMLMNFFVIFYLENLSMAFEPLYATFSIIMGTFAQTYLCVILCVSMPWTIDKINKVTQRYLTQREKSSEESLNYSIEN